MSRRVNTGTAGAPGQLTGLKDKMGTDICIGDTLAFDGRVWSRDPKAADYEFVVEWDADSCEISICGSASDTENYCRVVKTWDGSPLP